MNSHAPEREIRWARGVLATARAMLRRAAKEGRSTTAPIEVLVELQEILELAPTLLAAEEFCEECFRKVCNRLEDPNNLSESASAESDVGMAGSDLEKVSSSSGSTD